MRYPEIPQSFNISKILYSFIVIVVNILLTCGVIFIHSETLQDSFIGVLLLVPPIVLQSLSHQYPDVFHYVWGGMFGATALIISILYLYAFLNIFRVDHDKTINAYAMIVLMVSLVYIIPYIAVPYILTAINHIWTFASTLFKIPKEPNYMWKDMVFPSLVIGNLLAVFGVIANNIIQLQ